MENQLTELKTRLQEVDDLNSAAALLNWDQSTYMPPGGAAARGRQMAILTRLAHERFTDPDIGRLLDALQPHADALPYDSDDAGLIRVARRNYERATRIPASLMAAFSAHAAQAYQVWTTARPRNDFTAVAPLLQQTIDYSRRIADCFPGYDHIADPLIAFSDEGMTAASVQAIFSELRAGLVPLVEQITSQEPIDDRCLRQHFIESDQLEFGTAVIKQYGYDFERGRQDKTHHPFMTKFSLGDVRITTRVDENDLGDGLFSTLHEAGHALYEQGIDPAYEASPLGEGTSSGVHESQSRLWENIVGRSRPFWHYYYPRLQAVFPKQLGATGLEEFYRAVNKVQRSLIRTDADEVTYNLHVMIRFDLELALLEGSLAVADLPDAWHGRYESDLGVRAPSDVNGVLQDVHWFGGLVGGAFQGYTLGNIMSALFYDAAVAAEPGIPAQIGEGQFDTLRGWLTENIYRHGSKYTAVELVERITDAPLTIEPYMRYLRRKFGEIYDLS